ALFCLIPAAGQVLNGMSYMCNRWCFAAALAACFAFSAVWEKLMAPEKEQKIFLFGTLLALTILCLLLQPSRTAAAFCGIVVGAVFLLVTFLPGKMQVRELLCMLIAFAGIICSNGFVQKDYAKEGLSVAEAQELLMVSEVADIERVSQTSLGDGVVGSFLKSDRGDGGAGLFRYSGRYLTENANLPRNLSSSNYYWTISNPYIAQNMKEMELFETLLHHRTGYDDRTVMNTLAGVKYFAVPGNLPGCVPYDFIPVEQPAGPGQEASVSGYWIYENTHPLPLGYVYEKTVGREKWQTLSPVEKQETLLSAAYMPDCEEGKGEDDISCETKSVPCHMEAESGEVKIGENSFEVNAEGAGVILSFSGVQDAETYVRIKGLVFEEPEKPLLQKLWEQPAVSADLSLESAGGILKVLTYYTPDYSWYNDRHDFCVNMGYEKEPAEKVILRFSRPGTYRFEDIEILCQPFENYAEKAEALRAGGLRNLELQDNEITAEATGKKGSVLVLAIPFAKGWKAYVDGKETKLHVANIKYMGLPLSEGEHSIRLVYKTPLLGLGFALSLAGWCLWILLGITGRRKKEKSTAPT
nr:YfhO family protein [Lachnospiraceae bacterium]